MVGRRAPEFDSGWVGAGPEDDLDRRLADEDETWDRSVPYVGTVLGPVAPAALGPVLAGERLHRLPGSGSAEREDARHTLLAELEDAFAAGVRAVVDEPDPLDGSEAADLTGWLAGRAPTHLVRFLPDVLGGTEAERLPRGWAGIAVAAGTSASLSAAAVRAARWRCPLRVTADDATAALAAVRVATAEGCDPDRLSVSGGAWTVSPGEAELVLASGASLVVAASAGEEEDIAAALATLVGTGHGDRLELTAGVFDPADLVARGGRRGFGWLMERVPLALMEAGLDARAVRRILVDNPARTLTTGPEA